MTRQINQAGLDLIKGFETLQLTGMLPTPNDVPTAGYGHTGDDVQLGQTYTEEQAEEWLAADLEWAEEAVENSVTMLPLSDNQFAALVSLCFNIGAMAFSHSTLVRDLNSHDPTDAANEFLRWNKQQGTALNGLTRRRTAERELFLTS